MRLRPLALGCALGIVWGGSLFITTWISYYTGYAGQILQALAVSIYPGYTITPIGSFAGLVYGFADGFAGGALIAWIYNRVADR